MGKIKKNKGNRTITIVFYTVYFVLVAAIAAGFLWANGRLEQRLTEFEASQPGNRCQEVFQTHFADPDWTALYTLAGIEDTAYEGSDAFARAMAEKIGGRELTWAETSIDASHVRKYLLMLDQEVIGWFSLVDQAPQGAALSRWELGEVTLYHNFGQSVTIRSPEDITVYVNGIALGDDPVIRIHSTAADQYLPFGIHGPRFFARHLDGLMAEPDITAADAQGNPLEVIYNEEQDLYLVPYAVPVITPEEEALVRDAIRCYGLYRIQKAPEQFLEGCFDSEMCREILESDPWLQDANIRSFRWGEETISGYCRYQEDLFSAHVDVSLFVTLDDESESEYKLSHSLVFRLQDDEWKCISMTDANLSEPTTAVRLTFMVGNQVIYTNFFPQDAATLELPLVTAPAGQVFAGWFRQETAFDGSKTYTMVYAPEEGTVISLSPDTQLESMTLYALFQDPQ